MSPKKIGLPGIWNRSSCKSGTLQIVPRHCNLFVKWNGTEERHGEGQPSASQEEGPHQEPDPDLTLPSLPSCETGRKPPSARFVTAACAD